MQVFTVSDVSLALLRDHGLLALMLDTLRALLEVSSFERVTATISRSPPPPPPRALSLSSVDAASSQNSTALVSPPVVPLGAPVSALSASLPSSPSISSSASSLPSTLSPELGPLPAPVLSSVAGSSSTSAPAAATAPLVTVLVMSADEMEQLTATLHAHMSGTSIRPPQAHLRYRMVDTASPVVLNSLTWALTHDLRFVLSHADCATEAVRLRANIDAFYSIVSMLHGMDARVRIPAGQPHVAHEEVLYAKPYLLEEQFLGVHDLLMESVTAMVRAPQQTAAARETMGMHLQACLSQLHAVVNREYLWRPLPLAKASSPLPLQSVHIAVPHAKFIVSCQPNSSHCPVHRCMARFFIAAAHGTVALPRADDASSDSSMSLSAASLPLEPLGPERILAAYIGDDGAPVDLCTDSALVYLIEHPLRALAQFAQVRANMWVRNGLGVIGPAMMYSMSYWSDMLLDIDIAFLQAAAMVIPSPDALVFAIASRFEVLKVFALQHSTALANDSASVMVAVYALSVLVQISSPLASRLCAQAAPRAGLSATTAVNASAAANELPGSMCLLRRDIIQRLCVADSTFSSVSEHVSAIWLEKPHVIESVLQEVGDFAATRYRLKQELWSEYDPCFLHRNERDRESAEQRYKALKTPPKIMRDTSTHPFAPRLLRVLRHSRVAHALVFIVLHRARTCVAGAERTTELAAKTSATAATASPSSTSLSAPASADGSQTNRPLPPHLALPPPPPPPPQPTMAWSSVASLLGAALHVLDRALAGLTKESAAALPTPAPAHTGVHVAVCFALHVLVIYLVLRLDLLRVFV